jgi:hypothetical protein
MLEILTEDYVNIKMPKENAMMLKAVLREKLYDTEMETTKNTVDFLTELHDSLAQEF